MKRLDVYAQIHSRPTIQGGLMFKVHGDLTYDHAAAAHDPRQRRPRGDLGPTRLGDAKQPVLHAVVGVTGKMIGGKQVLKQTITREEKR